MKKYCSIKHLRYEIENESCKRVFIIPSESEIPDMKSVLCLSDTSLYIWELINQGLSAEKIIEEVCKKYNQAKETVQKDIDDFLGDLMEKGYIKSVCDD